MAESITRIESVITEKWKNELASLDEQFEKMKPLIPPNLGIKELDSLLKKISAQVGLAQALVKDTLLELDGKLTQKPVDINSLLEDVLGSTASKEGLGIKIIKNLKQGLPPLMATPNFKKALYYLIKNTFQSMDKTHEEQLTVKTCLSENLEEFIIEISGSSLGIEEELLPHVFELHYSRREGLKINLAVVKQVVDDHDGQVWAENVTEKGKATGAKFTIKLPINRRGTE
ncbi:MAG: ATP-binding protein [bacterium]